MSIRDTILDIYGVTNLQSLTPQLMARIRRSKHPQLVVHFKWIRNQKESQYYSDYLVMDYLLATMVKADVEISEDQVWRMVRISEENVSSKTPQTLIKKYLHPRNREGGNMP